MMNAKFTRSVSGFSLFELVVVLIVIAILSAIALKLFFKPVGGAQSTVVEFQANTFSRSIENIRALSVVQNTSVVNFGDNGLRIYVNKNGWPIATNSVPAAEQYFLSKVGCESLLIDLFRDAKKKNVTQSTLKAPKFETSVVGDYICRYIFTRKQEGLYFFDYDVRTGSVEIQTQ